jgi:hypothetical protein
VQSYGKFESRLQRWLCPLAQEPATDLRGSALDRGQLVDSRALIKIKILFGLHRDISAQKASKISIFCRFFPHKQNMEEKKHSVQKIITSTSGIYSEIFRLLAFVIDELDKVQFGWEASPYSPHLDPFTRFSILF